ncbi:MAG: hypothetical protein Q8S20_05695 [Sulfuritalea sp.]|nr:hypothetical protein [Sulfuritalea sp.]
MAKKPVYGIKTFPRGEHLWRVVLFGGISKNPRVPSEPVIEVLLSRVPDDVTDPLSPAALTSNQKFNAKIGVGMLPYVSISSCWRNRRPIPVNTGNFQRTLAFDTAKVRILTIGELYEKHKVMPPSAYNFGTAHWRIAAQTMVAAIEVRGDPWAVIIPTIELIRFYYGASTRLAQELFWGRYHNTFNYEKSGDLGDGVHRIHLKDFIDDTDAWTLARFRSSTHMQMQVRALYNDYQRFGTDWHGGNPPPFYPLRCGFPFEGGTEIRAVGLPLPGPTGTNRFLVLRMLKCSASFPFDQLVRTRDNDNIKGENCDDPNLPHGWVTLIENEDDEESPDDEDKNLVNTDDEPSKDCEILKIDIHEDRFAFLAGKELIKPKKDKQKVRGFPVITGTNPPVPGLSTGEGMWGEIRNRPIKVRTPKAEDLKRPKPVLIPATLDTFFQAIEQLRATPEFAVRFIANLGNEIDFSLVPACVEFPKRNPAKKKPITWSIVPDSNGGYTRRVAIVEIEHQDRLCYVVEGERHKTALATLFMAKHDLTRIDPAEWRRFLRESAIRSRWMSKSQTPEFRRAKTTHGNLDCVDTFAERIQSGIKTVLGLVEADTGKSEIKDSEPVTAQKNVVDQLVQRTWNSEARSDDNDARNLFGKQEFDGTGR